MKPKHGEEPTLSPIEAHFRGITLNYHRVKLGKQGTYTKQTPIDLPLTKYGHLRNYGDRDLDKDP